MAESELEDNETVWTAVKDELLKNEFVVAEWRSFLRKLGLPPVELVNIDHKYYKESLSFKIDVCLDRWRQQQGLSMDSWFQPLHRCLIKSKMKMLSEKIEKVVFEYANQDNYSKDNVKDVVEDASSNIKLSIHYVRFTNFATSLTERGIQRVFVDFYPFFGLPRGETETKATTGAILPNEELWLDFVLELPLYGDRGTDKLLAALVEPKEDEDRILFTVISDPNDQDVDECEDIGVASLHLSDIIESKQDINKTNLTVYHIEDHQTRKIGVLNVSLELLSVANDLLLTTSSLRDMQL